MIDYHKGGVWYLLNLFKWRGSVFPSTLLVAIPAAGFTAISRYMIDQGIFSDWRDDYDGETHAWSGFTFLVGFLIVFRTSQAHNRFWDGCTASHKMRAEWFDSCSALVAFCRYSKVEQEKIMEFKHTIVRLYSMLHAAALAELEQVELGTELINFSALKLPLIDPAAIDPESLRTIKSSGCKVELISEWVQLLIVENMERGVLSIPAPILTRAFQELSNGMVAFNDALKISQTPFPFPYAQTCDLLLIMHWIVVPFVTAQWVDHLGWAMLFSFIPVFCLWSLTFIAAEIEHPFGVDPNDLSGRVMQRELNQQLLMLLDPSTARIPRITAHAVNRCFRSSVELADKSFLDCWKELGLDGLGKERSSHFQEAYDGLVRTTSRMKNDLAPGKRRASQNRVKKDPAAGNRWASDHSQEPRHSTTSGDGRSSAFEAPPDREASVYESSLQTEAKHSIDTVNGASTAQADGKFIGIPDILATKGTCQALSNSDEAPKHAEPAASLASSLRSREAWSFPEGSTEALAQGKMRTASFSGTQDMTREAWSDPEGSPEADHAGRKKDARFSGRSNSGTQDPVHALDPIERQAWTDPEGSLEADHAGRKKGNARFSGRPNSGTQDLIHALDPVELL